ncbi:MAG: YCF48-related protein [Actinobacteria bacterium]|nr:YCF48-related protein [Actinomycetota bacterium]
MFLPAKIFIVRHLRQSAVVIAACLVLLAVLLTAGCIIPGEAPTPTIPADAPPPPTPSWQRIYTGVSFSGSGLGLISGWNGTIMRSTDAGATWAPVKLPVTADLYSVVCLDADTAIAVGGGGNILRSTDAGRTWVKIDSPTKETLNSVASTGGGGAVAVGWRGTIISTRDGGKTWTPLFASQDTSLNLQSVSFSPGGTGFTVSSTGSAFKSTDAVNWQQVTLPNSDQKLYGVDLLDNRNVILAGNVDQDKVFIYGGTTVFLKTYDGGTSWGYGPRNLNVSVLTIKFVGPNDLVAAGWDGQILRTNDGGNNWTTLVSHTTRAIRSMAFMDANNIFAVGDGETILHSRDGGRTWQKIQGQ